MSKVTPKISRRRLIIASAGTVAAAAAVTAARQPATPVAPEAQTARDQSGGYQLTEHVLTYYKTARV